MSLDYDQLAGRYAQHRKVNPLVVKQMCGFAELDPKSRILEIGCGTGNYLAAVRAATGCACWGCDPSVEMLARASTRSPDMVFHQAEAESLGLDDKHFDFVFSVDVIHHVEDRHAYFREAFRVAKPGGWVCTVTDSTEVIERRRPLSSHFPETVPIDLDRHPSVGELQDLLTSVGFAGIEEHTVVLPYALTDIGPYRDRAFSSLHLIPEPAFQRGLARLEEEVRAGPVSALTLCTLLWATRR